MQRVLTTVTLLGLLVLTAAAFAITEHLKLIKSPIYGTKVTNLDDVPTKLFSPVCNCANQGAQLTIRLRHHDRATVTIVDANDHKVTTVPADQNLKGRELRNLTFTWFGREADGRRAPDGIYHPWVHLSRARRTFRFTNRIILDTKPPKVVSASLGRARAPTSTLFADGGRTVAIHYAFDKPAHAVVYLGSRRIITGHHVKQDPKDKVNWAGTVLGSPLPAGKYTLSIGGLDPAGNETPAGERKHLTVVLRYVELTPGRVTVRGGSRFTVHVRTAASHYTWRLGRRHGSHRGRVLHLRAPTTPGTYRLVVTEDPDGKSATAVVRVHG